MVSLDLELYWGVRDKRTIDQYRANLDGVRTAVEEILKLFTRYGIHATWAVLGFLYFRNAAELEQHLPELQPEYEEKALSPYEYIRRAENIDDHYHFAPELIELIRNTPGQEIGTHTFSHYYCLEKGQTAEAFRADIRTAIKTAEARGLKTESLVFARNQCNPDYLPILDELGIRCYRGNENSWLYRATSHRGDSLPKRALRLLDAYVNLSGHHTHTLQECTGHKPFNIAASRFLRPCDRKLALFEGLRLRRIKRAMTHAAENGQIFHLWWHPHNFGCRTEENLTFLENIFRHFSELRDEIKFVSAGMSDIDVCKPIVRRTRYR